MATLGLDIGASKVYFVALETGKKVAEGCYENSPPAIKNLTANFNQIKTDLQAKSIQVARIGIGAPGRPKDGSLSFAPNFPELVDYPLTTEASKIFNGAPAIVNNDASAFTYAEAAMGAAIGFKNVAGLTLGSGLGSGLVIDGKLYIGKGGAEVGHTILNVQTQEEAEDLASSKYFKKLGKDAAEVRRSAEAGDAAAKKTWEDFGKNLGYVIANIVNTLDPEAIILGGGIAEAYKLFVEPAKATASQFIVNPTSKAVPILKSKLGPAAGALGAALLTG